MLEHREICQFDAEVNADVGYSIEYSGVVTLREYSDVLWRRRESGGQGENLKFG